MKQEKEQKKDMWRQEKNKRGKRKCNKGKTK